MEFLTIKDELAYSQARYRLKQELEDLFVESGYAQIEPPIFEEYDSYTAVNSGISKRQMVKIIGGSGKILILRPDTTINVIKNLIPRWETGSKLKLFYYSTTYRNRSDSTIREKKQMGIEYLGEESLAADRDVILLAMMLLQRYNSKFLLELGSSKFTSGLLAELRDEDQIAALKQLLARKNQLELSRFLASAQIAERTKQAIGKLLTLQGEITAVLAKAESYCLNDEMRSALTELKALASAIAKENLTANIHLDLSMITELDYYDGVIFKGYYPNSNDEILSGGRYDLLTELYGSRVPAIGFSVDLDKLLASLSEGGDSTWSI